MNGIKLESFDIEKLRERLRKMTDAQLLEFGRAARQLCGPEANLGKPPREVFVIQLQEALLNEKKASEKMTEERRARRFTSAILDLMCVAIFKECAEKR
jgi:hypothetical protein